MDALASCWKDIEKKKVGTKKEEEIMRGGVDEGRPRCPTPDYFDREEPRSEAIDSEDRRI